MHLYLHRHLRTTRKKLPLVKEIGFMLLKQGATSLEILKTKKNNKYRIVILHVFSAAYKIINNLVCICTAWLGAN